MQKQKIKFGVGGIEPGIKGYNNKFILVASKNGPIHEVLLFANSNKEYHREIADYFSIPKESVIGGGKMEDNPEKVFLWDKPKKGEIGLYLHDSSGEFGPVPFELVKLCIESEFKKVKIEFEEEFSIPLKYIQFPKGEGSSISLQGKLAADLFLAQKVLKDQKEIQKIILQIQQNLAKLSKGNQKFSFQIG